jgi:hypothetical protein
MVPLDDQPFHPYSMIKTAPTKRFHMRGRGIPAIMAFAAAACATGAQEPWGYDTGVDTIPDTSGETVWDVPDTMIEDTGSDGVLDPVLDSTEDTPVDPDVDPDPDPDPDAGCVSGTTTYGGTCNIIDRCGCTTGWCYWDVNPTYCEVFETCVTTTAGTATHGMTCDPTLVNACAPGLACLSSDGVTGTCQQWCRTDLDCPTGKTCTVPISFTLPAPCSSTATAPYDCCSL